jgi:selenide, water dikinase
VVWRRPDGRALVATVDVFTPIVDDPATWGRIAAVNAASDVYAMGGAPLFALAIAAWPRDQLPLEPLAAVLEGGQEAAAAGGWVVAGGHTIDGPEPLYGQAVVGEVDPDRLLTNAGGRSGDALVLTKPLGTGLLATAIKRRPAAAIEPGGDLAALYAAGVGEMTRSNARAAALALDHGAHAATDVTGFGLLGHLRELIRASGLAARIEPGRVPRFGGIEALLVAGEVPGGTRRNLDHVRPYLDSHGIDEDVLLLLADAQTSGGLLIALPHGNADELVDALVHEGHAAAVIGELHGDGDPGAIALAPIG